MIDSAYKEDNITYLKESCYESSFENNSVDFIMVAQAAHFFDIPLFEKEVNRVLKDDGIIAFISYDYFTVNDEIDKLIEHFAK